jgi:CRP/FNR family cyclic AMP-dependent transcriptional regulator
MRFRKETVILERRFVPKDAVVIHEGEYGAQAYLIQSGGVRVFTSHDGREVDLAHLGVGQIFGEMAMVFDGPRTASVQATDDCNLIVISRQQFMNKLAETDATVRAIVYMLTQRIVDSNNSLINKKSDYEDLKETARTIYQNIAFGLDAQAKMSFQNKVLPHLEALLSALDEFHVEHKGSN